MRIVIDSHCIECQLRRHLQLARSLGDERKATAFGRELMKLLLDCPEDQPTLLIAPKVSELLQAMYGLPLDRFRQERAASNAFVLERLERLRQLIRQAEDPVVAGLKLAIAGNYLDFSALANQVDFGKLDTMLQSALDMELDSDALASLQKDLERGGRLLYITDNAGEIGFDRLLAEELAKAYPKLAITFLVRGEITANDATREDAEAVGIPFPVIDNGNGIAGTIPELLSEEAREALAAADVILSKGMANVESLYGCGKNIYYAFLVKCPKFVHLFRKPMLTPLLVREPAQGSCLV